MNFVHLHVHTQYSLLDGANQIGRLITEAKEQGMPALAITDHGNLFGAVEFYMEAKKAGIKPILGCEAYLAPKSRFDREGSGGDDDYESGGSGVPYYHLILLAADEKGYSNLVQLVSAAHLEGYYYKPRIDKDLLHRHRGGLIALSACLRGEVPYLLLRGPSGAALSAAQEYREIFGPDNFYLEVQDNGLEIQQRVNHELEEISRKTQIPLVATNDCHYLSPGDTRAHDTLLCIQTGKTVNDPRRMRFGTKELYFKDAQRMTAAFARLPKAISATLEIAQRCNVELDLGRLRLPHYPVPGGYTRESYLEELAGKGLADRMGTSSIPSVYRDRLDYELLVINTMGFAGYFLIVWDIIDFAKRRGIPVGPGRGSSAGSLVAYALRITEIDPITYDLLFERFLNPDRIAPPDIDMDFCQARREEVINYVTEKYGREHVAQITTFGRMKAKQAFRDVCRVLEIPYSEVDRVAKLIPGAIIEGDERKETTLGQALQMEPRLAEALAANPKMQEAFELAKGLEGQIRHASIHAGGIVISQEPLRDVIPLRLGEKGEVVTQYEMGSVEKVGLVKFDFLGLRNLTVIHRAVALINHNRSPEETLTLEKIRLDDPACYELISSGRTVGLFQLESQGMRELVQRYRPERFEDLIVILALYRPGPLDAGMVEEFVKRRRGEIAIKYELPQLEEILKTTLGIIVYQEQVMKIAQAAAGYTPGEADSLRKAMGKKKKEEILQQQETFVNRCVERRIPRGKAERLFEQVVTFGRYGFNRSHSTAYAMIAYQTAYLKAHHPREFFTALLSSEIGNDEKMIRYITDCREMSIPILPPDVNLSDSDFTLAPAGIRYGLLGIKGIGAAAIEAILAARESGSEVHPFVSLYDLCSRVGLQKVNRRAMEALIKAGAFDTFSHPRAALASALDEAMAVGAGMRSRVADHQMSIFGESQDGGNIPAIPEWEETLVSRYEKEVFGFPLTAHPLRRLATVLENLELNLIESLQEIPEGTEVRICGIVLSEKEMVTRKGDRMGVLRLQDLTGAVEVIVFPDLYRNASTLLLGDVPLVVHGTIDLIEKANGEKALKVKALKIQTVHEARPPRRPALLLVFGATPASVELLHSLSEVLSRFPGPIKVFLEVTGPAGPTRIMAGKNFCVAPVPELKSALFALLGAEAVQMIEA